MPCDSTTLSSAVGSSSQPSSYDMPEQPPPTTRTRSAHSGLPSSSRRSEIFFAATSLKVTIQASFADVTPGSANAIEYNRGCGLSFGRHGPGRHGPSEHTPGGEQDELLERRIRPEPGHEQR